MAGTLAGTDAQFQKPGAVINGLGTGVATNYGVGLSEIHQYIKEKDYQHGDGNRESNTTGVSIEHEGGYALPDGTLAPVVQSTLDLSAKLCADIAKRNNLGKLVLNGNVFPHSHWVQTSCPGTLDMQYIVDKANEINGYTMPTTPPPVDTTVSDALAAVLEQVKELEATIAGDSAKIAKLQAQVIDLQAQLDASTNSDQIATLTAERDALQAKLDAIRTALG
jgi:hypothetical protein